MNNVDDKSLISIADEIRLNCNFLEKYDDNLVDVAKSIYIYIYEKTGEPNYLIRICNLLVKRNKRTTPEVLEYAKKALIESQHPDAVVYYGKSLILNEEYSAALLELNNLKKLSWNNENAKLLIDVFEGCLYYKNKILRSILKR